MDVTGSSKGGLRRQRLEHVPICVEQRVPAAGSHTDTPFCNLF
jgi:hypothetical protein